MMGFTLKLNAAHTQEAWNRVQQTGILRWGADTSGGAPYAYQDPKNPSRIIGFEVDIMDAIAQELGVKAKLIDVAWDQLVPALLRDDFDIVFNGLEITEDRSRVIRFTDPYYLFSEQLTVRAGDSRFKNLDDLSNHRVGTLSASLAHTMLLEHGGIEVVPYPGPTEPYKDLEIGRIDAVMLDVPIASFYAGANPKLENLKNPVGEGIYAGGVRQDSPICREKINQALASLFASGRMESIYKKWNIWTKNQEKLRESLGQKHGRAGSGYSLRKYIPLLIRGAGVTIGLSFVSMALAVLLGFALCLGKLYGSKIIKVLCASYIEIIRGTPLLIQLYLLYYGLPNLGIELNALVAAVLGLGLNYAAYEAEIYRAGLLSINQGQWDAAQSIGMTKKQSLMHIVLPQAFRTILPPSTNDFIALFKDSSLVSIITVVELTKIYNQAATATFRFLELGLMTAALYFAMSYPLSLWSRHLERKNQYGTA